MFHVEHFSPEAVQPEIGGHAVVVALALVERRLKLPRQENGGCGTGRAAGYRSSSLNEWSPVFHVEHLYRACQTSADLFHLLGQDRCVDRRPSTAS
jgi:hypothetical protein